MVRRHHLSRTGYGGPTAVPAEPFVTPRPLPAYRDIFLPHRRGPARRTDRGLLSVKSPEARGNDKPRPCSQTGTRRTTPSPCEVVT
jgi:hypothetical protein